MSNEMSDAEVICTWMEPKPVALRAPDCFNKRLCVAAWWEFVFSVPWRWIPRPLTHDTLREVQDRLTDEQWKAYTDQFPRIDAMETWRGYRLLLHATAEQKLRALAAVLRPLVEEMQ